MQKITLVAFAVMSVQLAACDCRAYGKGKVLDATSGQAIDSVSITKLFEGKTELEVYHVDTKQFTDAEGKFETSIHYGCGFEGPEVRLKFEKDGYRETELMLPRNVQIDTVLRLERIEN